MEEGERKIDSRKARTKFVVGVLQEALIEKNHFEESLNLPEYPRKPSMVVASDSVGKHCGKRRASEEELEGKVGKRKKHRMEVSATEYYA